MNKANMKFLRIKQCLLRRNLALKILFVFSFIIVFTINSKTFLLSLYQVASTKQDFIYRTKVAKSSLLDLLQWTDFKRNETMVEKNCQSNLDMSLWAPEKSAKICLLPLHKDKVNISVI